MDPLFDLQLVLPARTTRDLQGALQRQLRVAIIEGRLAAGLKLPATRVLATQTGVSRNTVKAAYEMLVAEGYVESRHGAGTFVAPRLARRTPPPDGAAASSGRQLNGRWQSAGDVRADLAPVHFDFRPGYPDQQQLAFDIWRRMSAHALRSAARTRPLLGDPQGEPALRAAISRHVSATRAVACTADDVVVTAGAQQAFDLIARVLITPGSTSVALEDPGYGPMRAAFEAVGAQVCSVPVDQEGLCVHRLPGKLDVVGVTPSHQFPLAVTMSLERRMALLARAREANAVIIEDDYDGEFRLGGRPVDALQTLDRDQRVLYVGTFSKSLFPSLRLGFVVAPAWAKEALVAAKRFYNLQVPLVSQDTLAAFIEAGHLSRHVRRMRSIYARRHDALLASLGRHLGDRLQPVPALAGLHLCAALTEPDLAQSWVTAAARAGIRIEAIAQHAVAQPAPNGLVFGYGLVDEDRIDLGIRALTHAVGRPAKRS